MNAFIPGITGIACIIALSIPAVSWSAPPVEQAEQIRNADLALRTRLQKRLQEISSDKQTYEDTMYYGELRSTLCKTCHGADGNAIREGTPNLAGQNPVYIVDQFQRYADDRRKDYWMSSLSKNFKEEDKIRLAVYYSQQKPVPAGGGNPTLLGKGEKLYKQLCSECHGSDGKSKEGYARLAGQRSEYVVKMLKEFKNAGGKRYNPWMFARANMLKNDDDMMAIATYLAQLK